MTAVAVTLLWLAAGYRLLMLLSDRGYINVSYAAASVSIAAAFTVKAVEASVDTATGPYVSDLLEHGLVVVGGVSAQLFLLALKTGKPPARAAAVRTSIASAVLVVMTVAFVAAPIHYRVVGDLDEVFDQLGSVILYRLVFNAYLTYVLVDNVRLCRRYAAIPGDVGRSVSLTLVGWGSALSLAYSTSRIAYALIDLALHDQPTALRTVGSAAAALGLCGIAAGMLAPRVVPGARGWSTAQRGTRLLGPLWRDLIEAFPLIALSTGAPTTPRRAELRFDRRLLETSEALDHVHIPTADWPTPECDDRLLSLALALQRSRGQWTNSNGATASSFLPPAADLIGEHQQLLALARAYSAAQPLPRKSASSGARP